MSIFGLFGPPNVSKLGAKGDDMGLIKALTYQKDASVRRLAAFALGKIGDDRAVKPLVAALKDSNYLVCGAAGGALLEIDVNWSKSEAASAAVPRFIAGLKDSDNCVRWAAGEALDKIGVARPAEPEANL
jgi:HEAT repeat protein